MKNIKFILIIVAAFFLVTSGTVLAKKDVDTSFLRVKKSDQKVVTFQNSRKEAVPGQASSTNATSTPVTPTSSTTTPPFVMSTGAGNTGLTNFTTSNYYGNTGFSEGVTRILKLSGFVAGGLGAVALLVSVFASMPQRITRTKTLSTRFE